VFAKINKLTLRKLIHDGIRKLSLKNDQFASVRINYSRGTNEGRTLTIDSTSETKDLDNLWLEFYRIKPNFNPISVFISQKEKINEFSLISKCKTFSYNQAIQVLTEANEKSFDDSILLNTSGELCCGSTFNLLIKRNNQWITPRKESGCLEGIMISKALKLKIVKEEFIPPEFHNDDIIVAINSLSCRQINQVNDLKLKPKLDPIYFCDLVYSLTLLISGKYTSDTLVILLLTLNSTIFPIMIIDGAKNSLSLIFSGRLSNLSIKHF